MALSDRSSAMQMHVDAMEREVKRLRSLSHKQSSRISKMRLSILFQLIFFIGLFSLLFLMGFVGIPDENQTAKIITQTDTVYITKQSSIDSLRQELYHPHTAAIPKDDYKGILFAIQIGAYKDLDLSAYKDNLLGLKQDTYDSIHQFTLGEFIDYEKAQDFLGIVQTMGFQQAHIMSYKNGYRLQLQRALELWYRERGKTSPSKVDSLEKFEATANSYAMLEE